MPSYPPRSICRPVHLLTSPALHLQSTLLHKHCSCLPLQVHKAELEARAASQSQQLEEMKRQQASMARALDTARLEIQSMKVCVLAERSRVHAIAGDWVGSMLTVLG